MCGAYCAVRAMERASVKWLMLAVAALGFAFLANMLEGLMVAPAFGLAYLLVAPTSSRPYLAGSTDNNFMNLVIGYNGLARILGREQAGAPGAAAPPEGLQQHGGFGGFGRQDPGITELFTG
ncbi:glycosyltransferase family 39 protein [Mycolicibacterium sarraceniae]|uniref:Glycosyltransferase RgtA/B/C/D-like domain-containing protein n=1 Tax=Mycolicibacterium sarraceniae TaxID=1534348 RepID=A0A7I7SR08_9MYCO|nr:glycosyltransferase family 39 protein [Mycolicibacterium sarraceniae]BBY58226.1 hypothetical protein MSAR_13620 [Mycolicibacterium sarraceniae]